MEPARLRQAATAVRRLEFAIEDPDAPENWPGAGRCGRPTCFGSSSRATSTSSSTCWNKQRRTRGRDSPISGRGDVGTAPIGQTRPAGGIGLSDDLDGPVRRHLYCRAATWYEKHDMSSTDMHPYVHAFTPAIDPPWETKSDYDIFGDLRRRFGVGPRPSGRRSRI